MDGISGVVGSPEKYESAFLGYHDKRPNLVFKNIYGYDCAAFFKALGATEYIKYIVQVRPARLALTVIKNGIVSKLNEGHIGKTAAPKEVVFLTERIFNLKQKQFLVDLHSNYLSYGAIRHCFYILPKNIIVKLINLMR